jgi:predicted nucleic acid-binding protein
MAPGVAAALLATVAGLSVAIPAMFAYNYMVTTIRAITQELDSFAAEFATALEHKYVDNRSAVDEIREALQAAPRQDSAPEADTLQEFAADSAFVK